MLYFSADPNITLHEATDIENIIIDAEFKRMFPILEAKAYTDLENGILQFGCLVQLTMWNGILIDGHNRYAILKKYGLPFKTMSLEFTSRDEVLLWIVNNQLGRRNLTPMQTSFYRGLQYTLEKQIISNPEGTNRWSLVDAQNEHQLKPKSTAGRLAEQHKVSPGTIRRDAQVATAISAIGDVSPEIKMDILSGKTRISRIQLQELAAGSKEDVSAVVSQIEEGTFSNKRPSVSAGDGRGDPNSGIGDGFADMQPWEVQFAKMTDEFRHVLRGHAKTDDTVAVKTSLRQYIEMLEELYRGI